ncbi:hypothetical protein [Actinoplanes siamensis]|uniref:Uncharacterized protein n=1 Tax=Actinoplanes siamensis TaxID=1223317 RepID=A0A919TNF6_9ACTN|nr:hypothetical protein [Actinoplanes siamensis]GIF08679.1 hypothetical protein Asi03nite_62170 [Actinoplanes siamensis]
MTQLCLIAGCRIRDRHLPDCDQDHCRGCLPRTAHEGYTCDVCEGRTVDRLALIAELAPDARAVAAGLVRRGTGGAPAGKPGSRPPLNDGATDALDEIQNRLTTLAREIADARGLQIASADERGRGVPDPLAHVCSWLSGQVRWVRHALDDQGGAYAAGVYAEIAGCARQIRSIVDGRGEPKYLGPCGAIVDPEDCPERGIGDHDCGQHKPCPGNVYGWPGAPTGTCRACGHQVNQDERRAYLDGEVREHPYRPAHIAEAYGVNVKTIRSWATRIRPDTGQPALASYWRTDDGAIEPWTEPTVGDGLDDEQRAVREAEIRAELAARGPRLHYVGDVLDLAAADAARRETERAKRARREAAQAAEMGA